MSEAPYTDADLREIVSEAHGEIEYGGTGNNAVASMRDAINAAVAAEHDRLLERMCSGCRWLLSEDSPADAKNKT